MESSVELCGGTHVSNVSDIYPLFINSDVTIGSGVRRIEAVAGKLAVHNHIESTNALRRVASNLNLSPKELEIKLSKPEKNKIDKELKVFSLYFNSQTIARTLLFL